MSTSIIEKLPEFLRPTPDNYKYAVVANFETPGDLMRAVRTARAAGYSRMEAFTPFPIHGIDEALGARRSILGRLVIVGALVGIVGAVLLQWWTGAVNYPLLVAGKPLFAIQPSVPIIFELGVLLSAFTAVFGMFALNKLPTYYHPVFNYSKWAGATNDRFLLALEFRDPNFDEENIKLLLESVGGSDVELVKA